MRFVLTLASLCVLGCPAARPPASQFPTGVAAIERLKETQACGTGLHGVAKVDHFGKEGRFRGKLMFFATKPANLEMDAVSPFGLTLATLTSDGNQFALLDLRDKRFLVGPAAPCNIARLTSAPIPGHALVDLLRGAAPLLKLQPAGQGRDEGRAGGFAPTVTWLNGAYEVTIPSTREARQILRMVPHPDDYGKPWNKQRMRLLSVRVEQYGGILYEAELEGHAPAAMSVPREDPETGEPAIPVSGPECHAEVPRTLRMTVPASNTDVIFRYDEVEWNPPVPPGVFTQTPPQGMPRVTVDCN
jgi:hypothetical protein